LEKSFEPRILCFACWWCSYEAADLAGTSKLSYPPTVRVVRVPCSGRVDPLHVLRAFQLGADGVAVTGCLKDGCHYINGNLRAERRVLRLKRLLDEIGVGGDRLEMYFMSAGMPDKFVESLRELYERVLKLGPNPLRRSQVEKVDDR
jgi:coenzyme F420-reducing hydrogenase delta subunit